MKTLQEIGVKNIPQTKNYENNLERYGDNSDSCICCGRPTSEEFFINTVEGPEAIKADVTEQDLEALGLYTQGMFPVGAVCAKKFGKEYIIKNK